MSTLKYHYTFLVVIVVLFSNTEAKPSTDGVWKPIRNVDDSLIIEVAYFAVGRQTTYKFGDDSLVFSSVIRGKQKAMNQSMEYDVVSKKQVIEGTLYDLVLSAKIGYQSTAPPKNYRAIVWSTLWLETAFKLISFKEIN